LAPTATSAKGCHSFHRALGARARRICSAHYTPVGTPLAGERFMSSFDHETLVASINSNLAPFRKAQPEAMTAFGQLAKAALAEGEVPAKYKELIALAIGVTQHCSGCVGFHVKALHRLGATRKEVEEMLAVAVYMGGGPALMYAAEVLAAWEQFAPKPAVAP
jgi:AhpD family alkylhydroperoxidase